MTRQFLVAYDDSMNELEHPYSPIEVYVWPDHSIRTVPFNYVDDGKGGGFIPKENVENWVEFDSEEMKRLPINNRETMDVGEEYYFVRRGRPILDRSDYGDEEIDDES